MAVRVHPDLYRALVAEEFELPKNCSEVKLDMPAHGMVRLHYTVNVSGDDLAKLGRALATLATP